MEDKKWLPRIVAALLCLGSLGYVVLASIQEFDAVHQCQCGSFEVLRYQESQSFVLDQVKKALPVTLGLMALSFIYPPLGIVVFGAASLVLGLTRVQGLQIAGNVYTTVLRFEGFTVIVLGILLIVAAVALWAWMARKLQRIAILLLVVTSVFAFAALSIFQTPCDRESFASLRSETINYQGQELPLYMLSIDDQTRPWALLEARRHLSTFVDPQNLSARPVEVAISFTSLERITPFDFRRNVICQLNPIE